MAEKLNPINEANCEKLKLKETVDSVNKVLSDACQLALKQLVPGNQTDASFRSAGFALMIEDNPNKKYSRSGKRTPPWRLD